MSFVNIEYMEELSRPGIFELASLPWAKNALAPVISEETINFHYGKHHSGYVSKLAAGASAAGNGSKSVLDIIKEGKANSQYNLAAQHWNHAFYWKCLSPNGGGEPSGALAEGISKTWGSFEAFKEKFSASAAGHFGSGWAWLVQDSQGALKIVDTHDAGNFK